MYLHRRTANSKYPSLPGDEEVLGNMSFARQKSALCIQIGLAKLFPVLNPTDGFPRRERLQSVENHNPPPPRPPPSYPVQSFVSNQTCYAGVYMPIVCLAHHKHPLTHTRVQTVFIILTDSAASIYFFLLNLVLVTICRQICGLAGFTVSPILSN